MSVFFPVPKGQKLFIYLKSHFTEAFWKVPFGLFAQTGDLIMLNLYFKPGQNSGTEMLRGSNSYLSGG